MLEHVHDPRRHASTSGDQLTVAVRPERSRVVVAPAGEIDLETSARVERELDAVVAAGFADIILDLRDVTFVDSTGLKLMLAQARAARDSDYRFRLSHVSAAAQRLLEMSATESVFEVIGR